MSIESDCPLISIIIPVFNTEEYLGRCLNSVVNQSIKKAEIIIINDLSTDNSENIIKEYENKFDSIKYLKMQSKGSTGGARNLALKEAKGKYIGFVDSDDWVDISMYEKMIATLENSNADLAVCGVIKEYESSHDASYRYFYEVENIMDGNFALELLSRRYNQDTSISSIACNKVYRRNFILENGFSFIPNNYNEDDAFNFMCFLNANKVAITPNTYYHYYQRRNSITRSFSKKHIDDLIEAFDVIKEYLIVKNIYQSQVGNFHAFFEKCLSFVLNLLITHEQDAAKQNQYINYLLSKSAKTISVVEYINYLGAVRLRNFLNPPLTR